MSSWFIQTRVETDRSSEPSVAALKFEADDALVLLVFGAHSAAGTSIAAKAVVFDLFKQLPHLPETSDEWEGALRMLDRRLTIDQGVGQLSAVGATLTDEAVVGASVGTCQAWLLGDASWELTRMQHGRPLLGTSEARPIGFGPSAVDLALLVGTSSLFENVDSERAVALMSEPESVPDALVDTCRTDLGRLASDVAFGVIRRKH